MADPTKLDGRDLDAAVAERLFGWRWYVRTPLLPGEVPLMGLFPPDTEGFTRWNFSDRVFRLVREGEQFERFSDWYRCGSVGEDFSTGLPHYSTDHNAAAQVLAEIEKRGLQIRFCECLSDTVTRDLPSPKVPRGYEHDWYIAKATPSQICRAALLSIGESDAKAK